MPERVIVITGASGGIGAATAQLLVEQGCRVVLVARRAAELAEVAEHLGSRARAIVSDATRREEVQRVVSDVLERDGQLDVWISNLGQGISLPPSRLSDADLDDMFRINVKSAFYAMQETLPHFKERGTGHVINISSMLGRMPFAVIRSAYSASKHYLNAMTAMFRAEVQQTHPGIQYSIVSPPVVRTDFGLNAAHGGPDSRHLPDSQGVEEVAAVIAGVVESRRPDVYTRPGARERVAAYYAGLGEDP